jgi:hypothetical protein
MNRRLISVTAASALMLTFSFRLLHAAAANEQQRTSSSTDIGLLMTRAARLPIEYHADIIFQLADRGDISPTHLRAVLDSIFSAADSAQHPFPMRDAVHIPDSLSSEREQASGLGLDTLNIKTHIIDKFIASNPSYALKLAEEVTLRLPQSSCADFMVPDVSPYYTIIGQIASRSTGATLHARVMTLERDRIEHASSSMELKPASKLVLSIAPDSSFLDALSDLTHAINIETASDREFAQIDENGEFTALIGELIDKAEQNGISPVPLMEAYRGFLTRSLSGTQCGFHPTNRHTEAQRFNTVLERHHLSNVNRLNDKDLVGKPEQHFVVESSLPDYPEFHPLLHSLFFTHDVELAERSSPSEISADRLSQADLDDYLTLLDKLTEQEDRCPACKFVSESQLYFAIIDSIPSYLNPDRAIDSYIKWCSDSTMQKDDPELWLYRLRGVLNLNRNITKADLARVVQLRTQGKILNALPHSDYGEIIKAARESTSNIVQTYAYAESVLKPNYEMPPL